MFTSLRFGAKALAAFATITMGAQASDGAVAVFNGTGNAYELIVTSVSASNAESAAAAVGGHLVTITSPAEQAFVEQLLISSAAPTGSYWMGLDRIAPGVDDYTWTTGEPVAYTNFAPGEANNYLGKEDDTQIYWTQDIADDIKNRRGGWNDAPESGYPNADVGASAIEPDLFNAGFVIERAPTIGDPPPAGIPLPPAVFAAPIAMLVAGAAARRHRKAMMAH